MKPMMGRSISVATAALLFPAALWAHNYTYLEGGYLGLDANDLTDDNGFRVGGSLDIAPPFAAFAEYGDTGRYEEISAGLLYHRPLSDAVDLNLGGSVEHADTGRRDDTGFGLRAGLRWQLASNGFELSPEVRYRDVFDDGRTSARLGALFPLTENLAAQGAVQGGDDDRLEVGVRWDFGPRNTGQ